MSQHPTPSQSQSQTQSQSKPLWSPSLTLLSTPLSQININLQCSGLTKYSKRCRWDIAPSLLPQIQSLLTSLSSLPPDPENALVLQHLRELAPLCLCSDFHAHQHRAVVARWVEVLSELAGLGAEGWGVGSSQVSGSTRDWGREEREREELRVVVQGLKEEVVKEKEEKVKWVERCNEAESAKERLLILVTKRGKEVAKSGREVERLEALLKEGEIQKEVEKRMREEGDERQVKIVEELKEKLDEQYRVSRQLIESLEDARAERERLGDEAGTLKEKLASEQHDSKQRRQALDEAERRTAELDAQIEGLNAQLSTAAREKEDLENTARESDSSRTALAQELDTKKASLLNEQETTAQVRREVNKTQQELANLQATLTQTQQELQYSQQANAAQATAHNLELTHLHERIQELETQLSLPFSKKLKIKMKNFMKRFRNSIDVPGRTKFINPVVERLEEPA